jgi:excisionase family DNA binding protein
MNTPLSVRDVVEQTNIPKRTIQAALARRDLKAHKFGGITGAWVIEQADLDAWLATRAHTS